MADAETTSFSKLLYPQDGLKRPFCGYTAGLCVLFSAPHQHQPLQYDLCLYLLCGQQYLISNAHICGIFHITRLNNVFSESWMNKECVCNFSVCQIMLQQVFSTLTEYWLLSACLDSQQPHLRGQSCVVFNKPKR